MHAPSFQYLLYLVVLPSCCIQLYVAIESCLVNICYIYFFTGKRPGILYRKITLAAIYIQSLSCS